MRMKKVGLSLVIFLLAFVVHKRLQYEYYNKCRYDIIHIVFFSNSDMCMLMKSVLDIIENNFAELMRPLRQALAL